MSYWGRIFLSPKRLITTLVAKRWLSKLSENKHVQRYGNYVFDPRPINADSVVYSFGIGRNVSFDRAIALDGHCKVYLFDVSVNAIEFARQNDPGDSFECIVSAVWLEDGESEIYGEIEDGELENASFTNQRQATISRKIPCRTIPSFMKDFGHQQIDILKMDIEGAALPVLLHLLETTDVRPHQIGVELERPKSFRQCLTYWKQLRHLIDLLKAEGYDNYCKTFKQGTAIEMLSIRR